MIYKILTLFSYTLIALLLGSCASQRLYPDLGGLLVKQYERGPFNNRLSYVDHKKKLIISDTANFAVGLKADGTVWEWGTNIRWSIDNGQPMKIKSPRLVSDLNGVVEVAAGTSHAMALTKSGLVYAWGENSHCQLGCNLDVNMNDAKFRLSQKMIIQLTPKIIIGLPKIKSIEAGENTSVAVDYNGGVWIWGYCESVVLACSYLNSPKMVYSFENIVKVSFDGRSILILTSDGKVRILNYDGSEIIDLNDDVVDVAGHYGSSFLLLNTGYVYGVGNGDFGNLGRNGTRKTEVPVKIEGLSRIVRLAPFMAIDENGDVWQWGHVAGWHVDSVFSGANIYKQPYPRKMLKDQLAIEIYCCSAVFVNNGDVWVWGADIGGRLGDSEFYSTPGSYTDRSWRTPVRAIWNWK